MSQTGQSLAADIKESYCKHISASFYLDVFLYIRRPFFTKCTCAVSQLSNPTFSSLKLKTLIRNFDA